MKSLTLLREREDRKAIAKSRKLELGKFVSPPEIPSKQIPLRSPLSLHNRFPTRT
ncbi:hypothetical protein M407DRAFT_246321 [Tulasnella calospora MUT 4182]|uniref:Uncharacterized protein n=1 Tax=Tulasnella calospora MUT 4182 TaxID=1051891 RepID=A0A0C3Q6N5_9AGAM|nr:hypothetical protein M407DRAFT_246321 [Tulasnella calospora MUT 4182]